MDPDEGLNGGDQASPMVAAYAAASASVPGHLVLYRVGEFYEALYESAPIVSRALGIQLTRRRQRHGNDIPMCGIPASRSQPSIARLLAAGHKLAISEQPVEPGGDRPLRLLTATTSVNPDVVPADRSNNLVVVHAEGDSVGLAGIDLSTGESGTGMASLREAGSALARMAPPEIMVSQWPEGSSALAVAVRGQVFRLPTCIVNHLLAASKPIYSGKLTDPLGKPRCRVSRLWR